MGQAATVKKKKKTCHKSVTSKLEWNSTARIKQIQGANRKVNI
jgi:hypothetical protein